MQNRSRTATIGRRRLALPLAAALIAGAGGSRLSHEEHLAEARASAVRPAEDNVGANVGDAGAAAETTSDLDGTDIFSRYLGAEVGESSIA